MSEEKTSEEKTYCYDCLKTKGFAITMPIIIIFAVMTAITVTGILNFNWLIFIVGWGTIFFLTFGTFVLSVWCLKEYCKIKGTYYKDPTTIAVFGAFTIVGIVVSIFIAFYFPENIEWWFSEHRSWN